MKELTGFFFSSAVFIFLSCGAGNDFKPGDTGEDFISFGGGGGFTGAVTRYFILPDGKMYKEDAGPSSVLLLGKLDKNLVRQIFNNYDKLGLDMININDPGNLYYFISRNKSGHLLTWGGNHEVVMPELITFHANLIRMVKDLSNDSVKN